MKSKWNERYGQSTYFYGTEPNSFLAENSSKFKKSAKVLCLAEGEGRNAVYLAKQGCVVTGVDSSQVGLDKLQQLAKQNGVEVNTVCCDLNDYVFESGHWDAVVSIWCHLPSELRSRVHKQVVESLKPQGLFLLEAYTPDQIKFKTGGPQDPDLMPTLKQLEVELNGLKPILKQEITRTISEGTGHQGLSAVVQYIGMKG
jgi:2-polyprenyl-3-methyl-5-hydroxy-6-metoxy-1,4-benzoquinol methylase